MPDDHHLPEGDTIPLQQLLTFRISRLNAKLNVQAARILKETAGISLSQWRMLVMVDSFDTITPAEIVRRTQIDKAQVSRAISSMVDDGLLRAESCAADNRSYSVSMTPRGRALFDRARPAMRARQGDLLGTLSDTQRDTLFACFDLVEAHLDAEGGSA